MAFDITLEEEERQNDGGDHKQEVDALKKESEMPSKN